MNFAATEILSIAEGTGFRADMLEKVLHLFNLLTMLQRHPFLKGKWVLKGGTALNLFLFDFPRLSVDIDLNYIGALPRETMRLERSKIEAAVQAVCSREGFNVKRVPEEHAGGKWRLGYQSFVGRSGNLEVDMNYMFRQPIWDVRHLDAHTLGDYQARGVPVLDLHELAAGKLAALLARGAVRDLFDCQQLFQMKQLIPEKLRIAFVVYGAMNRKDWRTVSLDDIECDVAEIQRQLLPMLRTGGVSAGADPLAYGEALVAACRKGLSYVLPFTEGEKRFLDLLLDRGVIDASLLTQDTSLQERIRVQPMLEWKAHHVRKHKGGKR